MMKVVALIFLALLLMVGSTHAGSTINHSAMSKSTSFILAFISQAPLHPHKLSRLLEGNNGASGDLCSECRVIKTHGLSLEPGIELPHKYICQSDCDGRMHFYSFSGDSEGFFEDMMNNDNDNNEITISTPPGSIERDAFVIDLDQMPEDAVIVHRNRRLSNNNKLTRRGERKVLVILVQDRFGNAPHQSEDRMSRDLFGIGEPLGSNNLVRECGAVERFCCWKMICLFSSKSTALLLCLFIFFTSPERKIPVML